MIATVLLLALALAFLCLTLLAVKRVTASRDSFEFIYGWGIIVGAWVWEDLVIFGAFFFLATLVTLLAHDFRIGLLIAAVFWVVRSLGEVAYFMLQQFFEPKNPPHNLRTHFGPLRKVFGQIDMQKEYIIMQVFMQILCVTAATCLILLIMNWHSIPAWSS